MRSPLALLLALACSGCGGAAAPPPTDATGRNPAPIAAAPSSPAPQAPDVVIAGTTGRIRSLQPAPDGRWLVSRLLGAGAVPAVLAPGASTIEPIAGWVPGEALSLRASPDGSQIAFTRITDPARPELWLRPASGGEGRRIAPGYLVGWMPDGAHLLAFTASATNFASATLDVVDLSTGAARTVVPAMDGFLFRGAAASADGTQIAFLRYGAASAGVLEPSNIFVVPTAGGMPRQLTTDAAGCLDLAWTLDGAAVLHSAQRGADRDIWSVPAAGGPPTRVAGTAGEDGVPAPSPDGQHVRYVALASTHPRVNLYDLARNATDPPRVLGEGDTDRIQAVLSPDGFQVAYIVAAGNASNLVLARVDGSASHALTETPEPEAYPAWAPDGSSIAYLSPRDGQMEIVLHLVRAGDAIAAPLRSGEPALTHGAGAVATAPLRFSLDGRSLLYLARRNGQDALMRLPVGGGEPVEVAPAALSYAWDPRIEAVLFIRPRQGGGVELVRSRLAGGRPPEVLRIDMQQTWLTAPALGGNAVYAVEDRGRVRVVKIDLTTGRRDPLLELPEHADPLSLSVDVSRDGRFVLASMALPESTLREATLSRAR